MLSMRERRERPGSSLLSESARQSWNLIPPLPYPISTSLFSLTFLAAQNSPELKAASEPIKQKASVRNSRASLSCDFIAMPPSICCHLPLPLRVPSLYDGRDGPLSCTTLLSGTDPFEQQRLLLSTLGLRCTSNQNRSGQEDRVIGEKQGRQGNNLDEPHVGTPAPTGPCVGKDHGWLLCFADYGKNTGCSQVLDG